MKPKELTEEQKQNAREEFLDCADQFTQLEQHWDIELRGNERGPVFKATLRSNDEINFTVYYGQGTWVMEGATIFGFRRFGGELEECISEAVAEAVSMDYTGASDFADYVLYIEKIVEEAEEDLDF